jgi:hypothetical protein
MTIYQFPLFFRWSCVLPAVGARSPKTSHASELLCALGK